MQWVPRFSPPTHMHSLCSQPCPNIEILGDLDPHPNSAAAPLSVFSSFPTSSPQPPATVAAVSKTVTRALHVFAIVHSFHARSGAPRSDYSKAHSHSLSR